MKVVYSSLGLKTNLNNSLSVCYSKPVSFGHAILDLESARLSLVPWNILFTTSLALHNAIWFPHDVLNLVFWHWVLSRCELVCLPILCLISRIILTIWKYNIRRIDFGFRIYITRNSAQLITVSSYLDFFGFCLDFVEYYQAYETS